MILTTNWDVFSNKIDEYLNEAKTISDSEGSIKTESELENVKTSIKEWNNRCYDFLKSSFDIEQNSFARSFYYAKHDRYHIGDQRKDFRQIRKEAFEDFKEKVSTLVYNKRILSISDAIIKPERMELSDRSAITSEEILEVILEKLYVLYDNQHYPILVILEGNGIKLKRHGEERELAKVLESYGYVNLSHARDVYAQLTIPGKMYVEEKRKTYLENYDDINKTPEEINVRIDEIIEKLTKLGLGQEILFDEIQELKELYPKLNKKNWGQIVKGKLLDLTLAKLIEKDTLEFIYNSLTNHTMRLP